MKTVLMISYFYPPIGTVTSERALLFSRLLPEFGWKPVMLAPTIDTLASIKAGAGMELPEGVTIKRVKNPDLEFRMKKALGFDLTQTVEDQLPGEAREGESQRDIKARLVRGVKNWIEIPDRMIDWYPFLVHTALKVIRETKPAAIISVCPPYTPTVAAGRLHVRTGVPLVVDLLDTWTRDFAYFRKGFVVRIDRMLERWSLSKAAAIIVNSELVVAQMSGKYPDLKKRFEVLPHAYDEDLIEKIEPIKEAGLNIVYAGLLHYPFQDIRPLFQALASLRTEGRDISQIKFQYMGRDSKLASDLAAEEGVAYVVQTLGQVPYAEALARMKGASALFYVQWEPGGETTATTKMMQYIGARRPILALVPTTGDADAVLSSTGAGVIARNTQALKAIIAGWLDEYSRTGEIAYRADESNILPYSYRRTAQNLATILDSVSGN